MLFGVFSEEDKRIIKRIPQTETVDSENSELFSSQAEKFFSDGKQELQKVEFQAGQTQSDDSILFISDFDDVLRIKDAISAPTKFPRIDFKKDLPRLKAIFMEDKKQEGRILFQLMDGRRIITTGTIMGVLFGIEVASSDTLSRLDVAGISLDSKLTAVMEGKKLYFKSFYNASRMFDLSGYLAEASEEGTIKFLSTYPVHIDDTPENFAKLFSRSQMRKIPKIMAFGYLEKYTSEELRRRAAAAKPPIEINVKDNKLVIPRDSDDRAVILDFLSNSIFSSHLDDATDYKSEHHRPLKS